MAALKAMLSAAGRLAEGNEDLRNALAQAAEQAQFTVGSLRGLITELRSAALDELAHTLEVDTHRASGVAHPSSRPPGQAGDQARDAATMNSSTSLPRNADALENFKEP